VRKAEVATARSPSDVGCLQSPNRPLEEASREELLREDFTTSECFQYSAPPLRHRKEDIPEDFGKS